MTGCFKLAIADRFAARCFVLLQTFHEREKEACCLPGCVLAASVHLLVDSLSELTFGPDKMKSLLSEAPFRHDALAVQSDGDLKDLCRKKDVRIKVLEEKLRLTEEARDSQIEQVVNLRSQLEELKRPPSNKIAPCQISDLLTSGCALKSRNLC